MSGDITPGHVLVPIEDIEVLRAWLKDDGFPDTGGSTVSLADVDDVLHRIISCLPSDPEQVVVEAMAVAMNRIDVHTPWIVLAEDALDAIRSNPDVRAAMQKVLGEDDRR